MSLKRPPSETLQRDVLSLLNDGVLSDEAQIIQYNSSGLLIEHPREGAV